jgi:cellulose synthase/poly-beta-1,6-N-acetylglucosamine synthase-like glycosyltransferase
MNGYELLLSGVSLTLAAQSAYSAALMLYAWEDEETLQKNRVPTTFEPACHRFTLLLPARHEEAVIQETIQRMVELNYPRELVQVLVVIEGSDHGTIAEVNTKLNQLREQGIEHVQLLTFSDPPINKPHGLNIGLHAATGDVVTIFDAEDEPHADILNVVNTVMVREQAQVVQCGVQLMNYADRWFSALNVLEYLFWFKSRMHYHATVGMVPLGGNTVFFRRKLLEQAGGWDQECLTEDADIGIRLSTQGVRTRVIYDHRYVTREETPTTVGEFVKQRTRWNQGFLQILGKGDWLRLPTWNQRLLALYTLGFPLIQASTVIYLPISLWLMFFGKLPILLALISSLPVYVLFVQIIISLVGLAEFTALHRARPALLALAWMLVTYMPYQWLLGFAALRAVWRQIRGVNNWEKTRHIGAHRVGQFAVQPAHAARQISLEDGAHG